LVSVLLQKRKSPHSSSQLRIGAEKEVVEFASKWYCTVESLEEEKKRKYPCESQAMEEPAGTFSAFFLLIANKKKGDDVEGGGRKKKEYLRVFVVAVFFASN
jgi:hypothetical protein